MNDFVDALTRHVTLELEQQDGEYAQGAVHIVDARNHLFRTLPQQPTDEAMDIYALQDLCRVDDDMRTVPDKARAMSIARNYFG